MGEDYEPTEEEKQYLKSIEGKYKDIYGMYYITDKAWQIEHALKDGREAIAILSITKIYEVLNSASYFQNVFHGDENDEEWKTRAALRDGLSKLITGLKKFLKNMQQKSLLVGGC